MEYKWGWEKGGGGSRKAQNRKVAVHRQSEKSEQEGEMVRV